MPQDFFGRDILARFHDKMNQLLDLSIETSLGEENATSKKKKSSKKSSGGFGDISVLFRFCSTQGIKGLYGTRQIQQAPVIGLSEPSDGHPQEELSPDFGW